MCAGDGRGAKEICLSEKGEFAKKRLGNIGLDSSPGGPNPDRHVPCCGPRHASFVLALGAFIISGGSRLDVSGWAVN